MRLATFLTDLHQLLEFGLACKEFEIRIHPQPAVPVPRLDRLFQQAEGQRFVVEPAGHGHTPGIDDLLRIVRENVRFARDQVERLGIRSRLREVVVLLFDFFHS